jgi:hypothetical protein
MLLPWQDIFAIAIVGLSAGYLAWQGWRFAFRRKAGGCAAGSCSGCAATPAGNTADGKPLVTISGVSGRNLSDPERRALTRPPS